MTGIKLMAAGVLLLAGGAAILIFSDYSPATPFIGGAVCAFLGLVDFLTPSASRGPAVSAGDVSDAHSLANLHNYGSAVRDTGGVFHGDP